MAREINHVIEQLSNIEDTSAQIIDSAEKEKEEYARLMEEKTKKFDEDLEKETQQKLARLEDELEKKAADNLATWRKETEAQFEKIDAAFDRTHTKLAQSILEDIVRL